MDVNFCSMSPVLEDSSPGNRAVKQRDGRGPSAATEGSRVRKGGECRQALALVSLGLYAGQLAQVFAGQL